eukprot:1336515-Amphidinium_carterae.1
MSNAARFRKTFGAHRCVYEVRTTWCVNRNVGSGWPGGTSPGDPLCVSTEGQIGSSGHLDEDVEWAVLKRRRYGITESSDSVDAEEAYEAVAAKERGNLVARFVEWVKGSTVESVLRRQLAEVDGDTDGELNMVEDVLVSRSTRNLWVTFRALMVLDS